MKDVAKSEAFAVDDNVVIIDAEKYTFNEKILKEEEKIDDKVEYIKQSKTKYFVRHQQSR